MSTTLELQSNGTVRVPSSGHGGKREGGGRPKGYSPKRAAEMAARPPPAAPTDPDAETDDGIEALTQTVTSTAVRKANAVADKEEALAKQAMLKYRIDSGEYLSRSAFREASATLLSELAQGLRSLTDELERRFSLAPVVLTAVDSAIEDRLNALAQGLEMFTGPDQ